MRIVAIGDQPTSGVELTVTPIAGSLGAVIGGVDLAHLDDDTVAAIRRAWLEHKVVFFRDQELTPEHFLAFAARMGELAERSEEHTSELQSLMRISYAVFCLKKKKTVHTRQH